MPEGLSTQREEPLIPKANNEVPQTDWAQANRKNFNPQPPGEPYLPLPISQALFEQKRGKVSESLKGSDPHMAKLF